MINFTSEPFADGELARFSFSSVGYDADWKQAFVAYLSTPRHCNQYFLIDNSKSLGNATSEGIKSFVHFLIEAGITKVCVAQISDNVSFEAITSLIEEIGKLENLAITSKLFATSEEGLIWLADTDGARTNPT